MSIWKDCYYLLENDLLRVGNDHIERAWSLLKGTPVPVSLTDKKRNEQWIEAGAKLPMYSLPARSDDLPHIRVESRLDNDLGIAEEYLKICLFLLHQGVEVKLEVSIYSQKPLIRQALFIRKTPAGDSTESERTANENTFVQQLDNNSARSAYPADYIDYLRFNSLHNAWTAVSLRDVTDTNNNLLSEERGILYPNERRSVSGNLLLMTNRLSTNGLCLIKEAPTSIGQLHYPGADFQFIGKQLFMIGSGITEADLVEDQFVQAYGSAVGVYDGTEYGGLTWIQAYHQTLRQPKPERDVFIMSNTWGDRSKDGRVSEAFVLAEIEAAVRLGITHVQIDDGWQRGVTSNSIVVESGRDKGRWSDYYADGDNFWDVHPERFPNGLEPVASAAKQRGIRLGLWFSPDSSDHFANWSKDAGTLMRLYEKHSVSYVKLDGIYIRSKQGEANLLSLIHTVTELTGGNVYFNLDTTAQVRQGYYYGTQYGGLFLENRYTDRQSYYPHWTLRNLWMISKYVPTYKLQMEFLNVERNRDLYGSDPLSPYACGIAYAFATVMFANPLAWMELSNLPADSAAVLEQLIGAYRPLQEELLQGHMLPLGDEPSGIGWTALQSVQSDRTGYVLVFREYTALDSGSFKLWNCAASKLELTCLIEAAGRNEFSIPGRKSISTANDAGEFGFSLPERFTFALYRYDMI